MSAQLSMTVLEPMTITLQPTRCPNANCRSRNPECRVRWQQINGYLACWHCGEAVKLGSAARGTTANTGGTHD